MTREVSVVLVKSSSVVELHHFDGARAITRCGSGFKADEQHTVHTVDC
jgi:hypothetical protein